MEERIVGAATVITVRGRFGVSADPNLADDFQGRVDRAVESGRSRVVLDLAGVSYVDSMGLGEIIRAHHRLREQSGVLKLLSPSPHVLTQLTLTKLVTVLGVCHSLDEALAESAEPESADTNRHGDEPSSGQRAVEDPSRVRDTQSLDVLHPVRT